MDETNKSINNLTERETDLRKRKREKYMERERKRETKICITD